jgi:hypothetical protein
MGEGHNFPQLRDAVSPWAGAGVRGHETESSLVRIASIISNVRYKEWPSRIVRPRAADLDPPLSKASRNSFRILHDPFDAQAVSHMLPNLRDNGTTYVLGYHLPKAKCSKSE